MRVGIIIKAVLVLLSLLLASGLTHGQGVCVHTEMKVSTITGVVETLGSGEPLENATLTLMDRRSEKVQRSNIQTDSKGQFSLLGIEKGRYVLKVDFPLFVSLWLPVRVGRVSNPKSLKIILGGKVTEPCGGGSIRYGGS